MKKMKLHSKIFIGLLLGIVTGVVCNVLFKDSIVLIWIIKNITNPIGQIFLRLIFMAVIPLIFSALALGVAEIGDIKRVGRIGIKTLLFTLVLSSIAVCIGIISVNIFAPGTGLSDDSRANLISALQSKNIQISIDQATKAKSFSETILEIIPKNPFVSTVNAFEGGLISLMFFSLIFGLTLSTLNTNHQDSLKKFLEAISASMLKIIEFAMKLAPLGVFGLIFSVTAMTGVDVLRLLIKYVIIVLSCLIIHQVIIYSAFIKIFAKMSPRIFFKNIQEVMVTAFSTSSSNATLPTTLKIAQENLKLPRDISSFVLTIGATANQNGTALYEGITVLFLAQFFGVDLTLTQQLTVVIMSIIAGVGTAGVPGGSLPLIVILLQSIGVPGEGIGIILGVDRILDMARTVLNVSGDLVIATCVSKSESA